MESTVRAMRDAVRFLEQNGFEISPRLAQGIADLENPHFRLAVVGKYQVGKSTLVNRVFIRDDVLLREGDGTPTTAVATEVRYGDEKRLDVLLWETETVAAPDGTPSADIRTGNIVAGESIVDPTPADLARLTTAEGEARTELTRRIAGVRLTWPHAALRQFTIFDTPGIDDPDHALLANTTYRVVPSADATILVVAPRQLDVPELEFLRSRLFAQGLTRLMVLVSYDPASSPRSEASRGSLLAAIKGQLRQIGREYVPVRMISYDAGAGGDVLNTPDAIEQAVVSFAEENVSGGRHARVAHDCLTELRKAIGELAARLEAAGKSEAERVAMLAEARQRKARLRAEYDKLSADFLTCLRQNQRSYRDRIYAGLDRIAEEYKSGFDGADDVSGVQNRLNQAESMLRPRIEDLFFAEGDQFRRDVTEAASQFHAGFRGLGGTPTSVGEIRVDGGLLTRAPGWVLVLADYVLADIILPGGFIFGAIVRLLLGRMPLIGKFMPVGIATRMISTSVRNSVDQSLSGMKADLCKHLEQSYAEADARIAGGFDEYMKEELEPLIRVLSEPAPAHVDTAQVSALLDTARTHEKAVAAVAE